MNKVGIVLAIGLMVFLGFQNCSQLDSPGSTGTSSAGSTGLDTTPPVVLLNKAPSAVTAAQTATFEFSSADASAKFECSLNGAPFQACQSPVSLTSLPDANYVFEIRATDPAGNISEVIQHPWRVDHTALSVTILSTQPAFTNSQTASVTFSGTNGGNPVAGFECRLDFLDYSACTSPFSVSNLNEGDHGIHVRARDSVGTLSSPAIVTWRVDRSPPLLNIQSGPSGNSTILDTFSTTVTFTFTNQDVGGGQVVSVKCKLDTGAATDCTNSVSYQIVGNGAAHTFTLTATDNAGNVATSTRNFSITTVYSPPPPFDGGDGG
ncbi:MAG: hypothetical protein AB7F86_05405 [Bdellovibrionales bacterium]